jgi:phosphodiesterase/alkaline phosphatase D-like protein
VADFTEYVQLYLEGWSDPQLRWLMSTVPTAMIFDDHDVRDDWNISAAWRDRITSQPWWPERICGALASYWVYQHIGNLSPRRRAMLGSDEFSWVERAVSEDAHQAAHVLIGSSLPWLLAPAIHDVQSATAAACARGSALGERIRQALDLEHWAAFRGSFHRLAAVLQRVAAGPDAPATISVLSGDVHHSYAARADVEGAPVYQLVSSPVHHSVPWYATVAVRAAWWGSLAAVVRSVVRLFGVADPTLSWRLLRAASWSRYPGSRWQVR